MVDICGGGTQLISSVNLSRLVQICQWLVPTLDNNLDEKSILLEAQSKKLVRFTYPGVAEAVGLGDAVAGLGALGLGNAVAGGLGALGLAVGYGAGIAINKTLESFHTTEDPNSTAENHYPDRLLKTMEKIEAMIETYRRFEAYQAEIQTIAQLGMSFHDWLKLAPSTKVQPDGAELIYIIPSKPLEM